MTFPPEYKALLILRNSAIAMDMPELTITYNWSLIRIACEMLLHKPETQK